MTLEGTRILVTGSTSGLGEAIAKRLASDGADVVVTGRDKRRGRAVAEAVAGLGPGRATFIAADLATLDGPPQLAREAERWLGGVDVLVNNAAIYVVDGVPIGAAELDGMFDLNVRGAFLLSTALMERMAERGHGSVVNITSPVAYRGYPGMAAYAGSKGALNALTRAWAAEYGPSGIRINSVSPGPVITPGVERALGEQTEEPSRVVLARTGVVAGRIGSEDDIAAAVALLAGREARYIHGTTLHVDGGMTGVGSLWGLEDETVE